MLIADAQVHIWGANTPERPWTGIVKPHRKVPLGADELLREMDAAGVHRAVLIPPAWDADRNDLVLEAARLYPDHFAVVGRLNTDDPEARGLIANWREQPGMMGLRCTFNRPQWVPALIEGHIDWLWEEAEQAGLPVMLLVTQVMVPLIDRIAERHPGLKLALSHLALSSGKPEEETFRDFDQLLLPIAKRPNVSVTASALPTYTRDSYPYRRLHPYLRRVYDAFGPERIFWGTDLARLPCSYRQAVTMFTEEIQWLTPDDKEWIMGRGLCEWLGWQMPEAH